jgi:ketosteroid isomerase-like protein
MKKTVVLLATLLALSSPLHPQEDERQARRDVCMDACMRERPNADMQREEVVALEKETARAIQLGDATFFRRIYSDDFSGVSSHGQTMDKAGLIAAVQAQEIKYESFTASDIKVRLYRDLAVATSSWSMRGLLNGQRVNSQMRVMHVYMYSGGGYRVVTAQTTLLPPYIQQPL